MPNRPLVLIVDDDPDSVDLLARALAEGTDIQYALSGPEALALVAKHLPDLILLDVLMPGVDGYEVCAALKRDPHTRDIPVIFITQKDDPESEVRGLEIGAADFIRKPIIQQIVQARVRLQLALKERERELFQLNATLEQRVIDRTQALSDTLVRAEAANRAKTAFLAKMSHELRTPMNAILGFTRLLEREALAPRTRDRLTHIRDAAERLLRIINDTLDVARLEAGKLRVEAIDFPLVQLLATAERAWREDAMGKGLTIVREVDPALPATLCGDPMRLRQVLETLLGNAIKFSDRGRVTLRARLIEATADESFVRFEVEDEGPGIGDRERGTLFNAFEPTDHAVTRQFGATGLGLAICRHLTRAMGGNIGVTSTPGKGSLFWINLRLRRTAAPAAEGLGNTPAPTVPGHQAETGGALRPAPEALQRLAAMLANDDLEAQSLWHQQAASIASLLGANAEPFTRAMESFDFARALELLRAANVPSGTTAARP